MCGVWCAVCAVCGAHWRGCAVHIGGRNQFAVGIFMAAKEYKVDCYGSGKKRKKEETKQNHK